MILSHMSRSAGGAVSCCQRSLLAVGAAALVCLLVYLVVPFGGVGEGVRSVIGSVPLLSSPAPVLGLRPPSALLRQPSAARCNRLPLPGPLANASALPAEPAAVRDPVTGEWLIFFTYQEVSTIQDLCMKHNNPTAGMPAWTPACIVVTGVTATSCARELAIRKPTSHMRLVEPRALGISWLWLL